MDELARTGGINDGKLIVVEGIDGSGTTTLVDALVEHYRTLKRAVHGTREPSSGPIGALLRQILSRRSVVQTVFGAMSPGWATMALLFAADRQDHLEAEILPLMRDGVLIISDRYDLSSLAYQSVTAQNDAPGANQSALAWIHELNRHARRPDLTLVLDVTSDLADQRRRARGGWKELYDDRDLQDRLVAAYRRAEELTEGDRIVHLDATRSPEQVLGEALDTIGQLART